MEHTAETNKNPDPQKERIAIEASLISLLIGIAFLLKNSPIEDIQPILMSISSAITALTLTDLFGK